MKTAARAIVFFAIGILLTSVVYAQNPLVPAVPASELPAEYFEFRGLRGVISPTPALTNTASAASTAQKAAATKIFPIDPNAPGPKIFPLDPNAPAGPKLFPVDPNAPRTIASAEQVAQVNAVQAAKKTTVRKAAARTASAATKTAAPAAQAIESGVVTAATESGIAAEAAAAGMTEAEYLAAISGAGGIGEISAAGGTATAADFAAEAAMYDALAAEAAATGGAGAAGGTAASTSTLSAVATTTGYVLLAGAAIWGVYVLYDAFQLTGAKIFEDMKFWPVQKNKIEFKQRIQIDCDHPEEDEAKIQLFNADTIPWLKSNHLLTIACTQQDPHTGLFKLSGGNWIGMEVSGPLIAVCGAQNVPRALKLIHGGTNRVIDIPNCVRVTFGESDSETWLSGDQDAGLENFTIELYPVVARNIHSSLVQTETRAGTTPVNPQTVPEIHPAGTPDVGTAYIRLINTDYASVATALNKVSAPEQDVYPLLAQVATLTNADTGEKLGTKIEFTRGAGKEFLLVLKGIAPGNYVLNYNSPHGVQQVRVSINKGQLNYP